MPAGDARAISAQLAEITTPPPPPPLLRFGLRTAPVNLHMPFPGSHGIEPLTRQNRSSSHFLLTPYSTHASCPSERRTSGMVIIAKRPSHSQTRPLHSLAPLAPAENRHRASSLGTKAITCTNPFLTPRPSTGTREENSSPSLRGAVPVLRASPQPLPSLAKPCVRAYVCAHHQTKRATGRISTAILRLRPTSGKGLRRGASAPILYV